jgi:hypothetical protein
LKRGIKKAGRIARASSQGYTSATVKTKGELMRFGIMAMQTGALLPAGLSPQEAMAHLRV